MMSPVSDTGPATTNFKAKEIIEGLGQVYVLCLTLASIHDIELVRKRRGQFLGVQHSLALLCFEFQHVPEHIVVKLQGSLRALKHDVPHGILV
jgi:hypothetical protein